MFKIVINKSRESYKDLHTYIDQLDIKDEKYYQMWAEYKVISAVLDIVRRVRLWKIWTRNHSKAEIFEIFEIKKI